MDGQLYEIKKFSDLDEANSFVVNEGYEMAAYIGVWDFLGCGSETAEDGTIKPYYLLGLRLYNRPEWVKS